MDDLKLALKQLGKEKSRDPRGSIMNYSKKKLLVKTVC